MRRARHETDGITKPDELDKEYREIVMNRLDIDPDKQARALYDTYPRHTAKPIALKAIKKALAKETYEVLLEAVQAYAAARNGQNQKFTPHPATWFNQERWTDDRDHWRETDTPSAGSGQTYDPGATAEF